MGQPEQVKPTREPGPVTRRGLSRTRPRAAEVHLAEGCVKPAQPLAAGASRGSLLSRGARLAPTPVLGGAPLAGTAGHRKTLLLL